MQRRDLLKMIMVASGTAMVGAPALAYKKIPAVPLSRTPFSEADVAFMNEVAEVILPQTDTPGAKAANVGITMAVIAADCYTDAQRKQFRQGLRDIDSRAKAAFGKPFLLLTSTERTGLLTTLNQEALDFNAQQGTTYVVRDKPSSREPGTELPLPHPFSLVKQLTLYTFFTSETGAKKVLRYVPVPGYYDGDLPYKKGDKAWAT